MKVLDQMEKTKPTPAPRHPTSSRYIDDIARENPDIVQMQSMKNDNLIKNMENMLANPDKVAEISTARSLPMNRKPHQVLEFGYQEPEVIPAGKTSIKQVLEFISMRHTDPEKYSVEYIAKNYNLETGQVERLLKYYHIFKIQMPKGSKASDYLENYEMAATPGLLKNMRDKLLPGKDS